MTMDQVINSEVSVKEEQLPELTEAQKEKRYGNIERLRNSTGCILQYELRLHVYQTIIKRLKKLGDYKDAPQLIEQYQKMIEELQVQGQEEIYQGMLQRKAAVKKADDIQWVLKEANRIPDYKDSKEVVAWCEAEFARQEKIEQQKATIRLIILLVVIAVIAVLANMAISMLGR